jgi:hypothetical protein
MDEPAVQGYCCLIPGGLKVGKGSVTGKFGPFDTKKLYFNIDF